VRIYRTRSTASAACVAGHVTIDGRPLKPAHKVAIGDTIEALAGDRTRILEVARLIEKRVGAQIAAECYVDHSPPPPPKDPFPVFGERDRGAGRPTKRERREIDRFLRRQR
jgi:ribosome-associated heat shock protein Hsp15